MIATPSKLLLNSHYYSVIRVIAEGKGVFFLGDEINSCSRQKNENGEQEAWRIGNNPPKYPPTNIELALYLDEISDYVYSRGVVRCPLNAEEMDHLPDGCPVKTNLITKIALQHVSQYIDLLSGRTDILPGILGQLFESAYPPNSLHKFLARLPKWMREKGYPHPFHLIVTTCFDNTLERAFKEAEQPFDLISFIGDQSGNNRFIHQKFRPLQSSGNKVYITEDGEPIPIKKGNEYREASIDNYPVILKLYGNLSSGGNFVVTEDQCIDYLAHKDIHTLMPVNLLNILQNNPIVFLGYSPNYWNLRVILHRIWPDQIFDTASKTWWAIQSHPEIIEQKFWVRYTGQEPISIPLGDYVAELNRRIESLPNHSSIKRASSQSIDISSALPQKRNKVFISYSHKDKAWLDELKTMLIPVIRAKKVSIWDDTQILAGAEWKEEIEKALATAKIAVLLVSANFLASDFIDKEELPPLLAASKQEGLRIIWVYLSTCLYKYTPVADYQAAHDVSQPLDALEESQRKEILAKIGDEIAAATSREI